MTEFNKNISLPKRVYIVMIISLLITYGWRSWKCFVIGSVVLILLVYYEINYGRERKKEVKKRLEGILIDEGSKPIGVNMPVPMVAVEIDGRIVWKNKSFYEILEGTQVLSTKIQSISRDLDPREFLASKEDTNTLISLGDKKYRVTCEYKKIGEEISEDKFILLYYLFDKTDLVDLQNRYNDEKFVVGILYIDCYEDLILSIDDERRQEMLLELDKTIQNWLVGTGAIARKVERDKYIVIIESKWMNKLEQDNFKILSMVKEVRMGNTIPLTVSIGFGMNNDTYVDNLDCAKDALDIALGRGGDQVVIKNKEETYFYGGNTVQAEKRTKVKARVVAYALRDLIEQSENVLIMGHKNCDMDALGSALGIWSICKNLNRQANIVLNNSNININNMIKRLANKERFGETFINDEEALERVEPNTLLVIVDTNKQSITECEDLLKYTDRIVIIDHHRRGTEYIKDTILTYLETYASSASEMVTELIYYLGFDDKLDELEAQALYTGILVDTKNFLLKTGVRTFEVCALLRKYNIDTISIKVLLQNDLKTYTQMSNVINVVQLIDNKVALSVCDLDTKDAQLVAAKAADQLLNIEEIDASFVLSNIQDDVYISGRSLGTINVQMILEKLGGGGSFSNAGAKIQDSSIEEVLERLKNEIYEYLGKRKQE